MKKGHTPGKFTLIIPKKKKKIKMPKNVPKIGAYKYGGIRDHISRRKEESL